MTGIIIFLSRHTQLAELSALLYFSGHLINKIENILNSMHCPKFKKFIKNVHFQMSNIVTMKKGKTLIKHLIYYEVVIKLSILNIIGSLKNISYKNRSVSDPEFCVIIKKAINL